MAVMLRTLDIPARVAVGYTQGKIVGTSDVRRVSTENLHFFDLESRLAIWS